MEPTLVPGDFVLVEPKAYENADPRPGEVVVAHHPYQNRLIVKRVSDVNTDGILLKGDNAQESTDGRSYGRVQKTTIMGRVACRLI